MSVFIPGISSKEFNEVKSELKVHLECRLRSSMIEINYVILWKKPCFVTECNSDGS